MNTIPVRHIIALTGCILIVCSERLFSQDTAVTLSNKIITLKEVVVRNNLNVADFIHRVETDTSFYKAFKNLRIIGYSSLNDIRMMDKKGNVVATLQSKTRQTVQDRCRTMTTSAESVTGDIYDDQQNWNYYTAELYASLFFTKGTVCNETNTVSGALGSSHHQSGVQKRKEQLKMLMFSPGTRIPGIPFIGDKIAIFDNARSGLYDFTIDMDSYQGQNCYLFTVKARDNLSRSEKNDIVINKMTTWFDSQTMEIVSRNYDLSYDAGVYDFDVHMQVELTKIRGFQVPKLIRYTGNWHAIFKKRGERNFYCDFI